MTRRGVFPAEVPGRVCLWVQYCGQGDVVLWWGGSGPHWKEKDIVTLRKAKWLTQDHTVHWRVCLLTTLPVPWITLPCSWAASVFSCLCMWAGFFFFFFLEKKMATHAWLGNPKERGTWGAKAHRVAKSQTQLSNYTTTTNVSPFYLGAALSCQGLYFGSSCLLLSGPSGVYLRTQLMPSSF